MHSHGQHNQPKLQDSRLRSRHATHRRPHNPAVPTTRAKSLGPEPRTGLRQSARGHCLLPNLHNWYRHWTNSRRTLCLATGRDIPARDYELLRRIFSNGIRNYTPRPQLPNQPTWNPPDNTRRLPQHTIHQSLSSPCLATFRFGKPSPFFGKTIIKIQETAHATVSTMAASCKRKPLSVM